MSHQPSIAQQLDAAQLFIGNVRQHADLLAVFEAAGRGADHFDAAWALYQQAYAAHLARQQAYGARAAALARRDAFRDAAHAAYHRHVRLARLAFDGDEGIRRALALKGPRRRALAAWMHQALGFYDQLLASPPLLEAMASLGVTTAHLAAVRLEVLAVQTAAQEVATRHGEAYAATQARDAALKTLWDWMVTHRALARILFAHDPQMLEQLGMLARS